MRPTFLVLVFLALGVSQASCRYDRLRGALKNFSAFSYDDVHKLVVLDQIEAYTKPIKSAETRSYRSLNGLYDFCFDPQSDGFTNRWFERPLAETCPMSNYYRMPVPSAFNDILSNRTAKNYVGWMWYQSDGISLQADQVRVANAPFDSPANWVLQVESINYMAIIWVQVVHQDGRAESHLVGSHVGGHLPITMNISDILEGLKSDAAQIRLTVAVNNLLTPNTIPSGQMLNMTKFVGRPYFKFQPDFDFFNFAGIMGDVRLFWLPEYFIEDVELYHQDARRIKLCLNAAPEARDVQIIMALGGKANRSVEHLWTPRPEGREPCSENNLDDCDASDRCSIIQICPDEQASCDGLTRPDSGMRPALARLRLSHLRGANRNSTQAGVRTARDDLFELRLFRRSDDVVQLLSRINGTAQLQGFGMHHEQLFSGRAMSLPSIMKDLYLVKQTGANVIRTSHYPYSTAYLDACDQLGLWVIAECPAVGMSSFDNFKLALHKQLLLEMMQRDHHHPAIVMWSLANEPQSQLPEARAYFESLVAYAKNDLARYTSKASRPVTAAIAQSHRDDKVGDLLDVIMVNRYYGWYDCTGLLECVRHSLVRSLTGWADKYGRAKPIVLSEFGADTLAGLHSSTGEIFTEEFQRDLVAEYERVFDELAANRSAPDGRVNFLGAMVWNFADFSTHESLLRVGGNRKGVFSLLREPKLAEATVRQFYHSRPPIPAAANY